MLNRLNGNYRLPVWILGATGLVGRKIGELLDGHPWFRLTEVGASSTSAGKIWRSPGGSELSLRSCSPVEMKVPLVFSALPARVARKVEPRFARAGCTVISNASAFRLAEDVPLIIPEVNPGDLKLLPNQRHRRDWNGAIITNPNCAAIVIALALAPLAKIFGIRRVIVTTMQAVSGAGNDGIGALKVLGNVLPNIPGEEDKIRGELPRLLAGVNIGLLAAENVIATTCRVPVANGHTASILVETVKPVKVAAALRALEIPLNSVSDLPSAQAPSVVPLVELDRPQPVLDAARGDGMSISVGQLRGYGTHRLGLVACGDNLVRGAAGAAVLNGELLLQSGQSGHVL
jgi:aspartate-semialdehyde dehydrogenase